MAADHNHVSSPASRAPQFKQVDILLFGNKVRPPFGC